MTNKPEFKLDFCGIGFPKCATSWVGHLMTIHSEVDFARSKETNFFLSKNYMKQNKVASRACSSVDEFRAEFQHNGKKKGEFAIHYVYDPETLMNLKKHNPDIKILVCIREQKDAINSLFWFDKASRIGHTLPDSLDLLFNDQRYKEQKEILLEKFEFYRYIQKVFELFDRENILVILQDDIKDNTNRVIEQIEDFLSIGRSGTAIELDAKINTANAPRSLFSLKVADLIYRVLDSNKLGRRLIYKYFHGGEDMRLVRFYNKIFKKKQKKPELKPTTINKIYELFKDSNQKLSELIDRAEIVNWNKIQR